MRFLVLPVLCILCSIASASFIFGLRSRSESESSPNPIKQLYPWNTVTGTINGTVSVVPIPYELARSIIPAKYNILSSAYESLLPGFPADSYPVSIPRPTVLSTKLMFSLQLIVKAILDHDLSIPDFQVSQLALEFKQSI